METRERRRGRCARLMTGGLIAIAGLTAVAGCGNGVEQLVHSQQDMIVLSNARQRDALPKSGLNGPRDALVEDSRAAPKRDGQTAARRIGRQKAGGQAGGERRGVSRSPGETGVPTSYGAS